MDAIPAAVGEEAAHAPLYIEEFKRWMRAQGKTDVLAKQTARSLVLLFEEDGKSIASMATPGYFDLVKPSEKNRLSHNQRSSALKHLQTFWQQRAPGPPEDGSAPDASPKQKRGPAAPGSAASASAATPRSAGERQGGTPAQSAPDAKAFSPGSAGEGSARQDKGPDPPLSQDAKKGGGDRKAQRKRWKQRHRSGDVGVAAAPSLPMSAEHRREVQREKEKRKSERKQEVERKKQKKDKEEGEKPEHKRPPAVPLASAHGVEEILEQAKQLASEGRISKAVCVFGRDPSSKNSSVNGVYVDRDKPFHGRNAYKQEGGDRFLFYSSTKGAWKVSDSLDDSKNGFAFAKVDDRGEGLPSDAKHNLAWRVFGGKSEGYKKDRGLRCLSALALLRALAPESAAALAPDNDAADNCDESDGEQGSGESSSCQQGSDAPSSDERGAASSSGSSSGGES